MIPLAVVLPLAVALLAADVQGRMRDVYRSIIFMPMIMAPVVVSLIWLWILNPLQGILNHVLKLTFGLPNINWLGDESTAVWVIVFITGWKILGFSFILYAAAITGIDRSYTGRGAPGRRFGVAGHPPHRLPAVDADLLLPAAFSAVRWPVGVCADQRPDPGQPQQFDVERVLHAVSNRVPVLQRRPGGGSLGHGLPGDGRLVSSSALGPLHRRSHFDNCTSVTVARRRHSARVPPAVSPQPAGRGLVTACCSCCVWLHWSLPVLWGAS